LEKVKQKTLLGVENLYISFYVDGQKTISAVKDINFHINEGETVALVGESGCGKSVTALSIMQLLSKSDGKIEGRILLGDKDLNQLSEKEMQDIRGNEISMIFQEPM